MLIIPTQPIPAQIITVTIGQYNMALRLYQRIPCLFVDVALQQQPVITGIPCQNLNRIIRSAYRLAYYPGFGDLFFFDNHGMTDPIFTGLGSRYSLAYLDPDELANAIAVM